MIIHVETCWGGKEIYFRFTLPCGIRFTRENGGSDKFDRKFASSVLDTVEHCYHYERRNVRFKHR